MDNTTDFLEKFIRIHSIEFKQLLLSCENEEVAKEEIELSISAIKNAKYLHKNQTIISVFLPVNLPLYSFVIYVLTPSLVCERIYFKPSSSNYELLKKIYSIFKNISKNIFLYEGNRNDFCKYHVTNSNIVIFVGNTKNSYKVKKYINENTLFLCFGNGINAIVAFNNSNINELIDKIHCSISFNDGQDCGKPTIIFLQKKIEKVVISKIIEKTKYYIAHIYRDSDLLNLVKYIQNNRDKVINKIVVDLPENCISPILTKTSIKDVKALNKITVETYGPVYNFIIFNDEKELEVIKQIPSIMNNLFYVSKFGDGKINFSKDIQLKNATILDYDSGYNEFGNHNINCSYLSYKGINIAKPLLVNREINVIYNNDWFKYITSIRNSRKKLKYLLKEIYRNEITRIFSDNLIYSFIFGSFVKNKKNRFNDIDIFICVEHRDNKQINEFLRFYFFTHYLFGFKPDIDYPGEIVTMKEIQTLLCKNISIKNTMISKEEFDYIFYNQILNDKKENIYGNFDDLRIHKDILSTNSQIICKSINELIDYSKYSAHIYNKSLFALSTNDILFFSNFLSYPSIVNYDSIRRVKEMDDGLFLIYERGDLNEFN